jgi:hypothetical protein
MASPVTTRPYRKYNNPPENTMLVVFTGYSNSKCCMAEAVHGAACAGTNNTQYIWRVNYIFIGKPAFIE